jgi:hypothetical protein
MRSARLACLLGSMLILLGPLCEEGMGRADPAPTPVLPRPAVVPSPPSSSPESEVTHAVPLSVREVSETGKALYDAAQRHEWATAAHDFAFLRANIDELRTVSDSADVDLLRARVIPLGAAVRGHDRLTAMRIANEMTLLASDLSVPYGPLIPADLDRLAYYGRALCIASESGDLHRLQVLRGEIHQTWPLVRSRAETKSIEATRQFVLALEELDRARTPVEFGRAAADELRAVVRIELSLSTMGS